MKIKQDFVTNSSSTSFILRSGCHLKQKNINIDCKQVVINFLDKNNVIDKKKINFSKYSDNKWTFVNGTFLDTEDNSSTISIELVLFEDYDNDVNEIIQSLIIDLVTTSKLISTVDDEELYRKKLIEILDDLLKDIPDNTEIFYHQEPCEISGDGWNGGDAMGIYNNTYDLYKNETKVEKLVKVDGKFTFKSNDSNVDKLVLNDVLDYLDDQNFSTARQIIQNLIS